MTMNGKLRRGAALLAAIVLCASARADIIEVGEGDDLAAAINGAAAGDTVQLKGRRVDDTLQTGATVTWPLNAPVVVTRDLVIQGEAAVLPSRLVISGVSDEGGCPGNTVANPGFEAGAANWTESPAPVVVNEQSNAAEGSQYARFTTAPCAPDPPTGVAENAAELRYRQILDIPPLPPVFEETVVWTGAAFPSLLTQLGLNLYLLVKVLPGSNTAADKLEVVLNTAYTATALTPANFGAHTNYALVTVPLADFSPAIDLGTVNLLSFELKATWLGDTADPTIFLVAGVEFGLLPPPTANALGLVSGVQDSLFSSLNPPKMVNDGGFNVIRLGGLGRPRTSFQAWAETVGATDDKLEMLVNGVPVWAAAPASAELQDCEPSITLPGMALHGDSAALSFRATIKAPDDTADPPVPSTVFVVDGLVVSLLSPKLDVMGASMNMIAGGDFESPVAASAWEAWTPCEAAGSAAAYFGAPACAGARAMVFKRMPVLDTVELYQTGVTVPDFGEKLTFSARVESPGTVESFFEVTLGGQTTRIADAKSGGSSWKTYEVPYAETLRGQTTELRFTARIVRGAAPSAFALDQICLGNPPTETVITVSGAKVLLENLTLADGGRAVHATDGGKLTLVRCATSNIAGDGVYFSGEASGLISNSVIRGCTGAAVNNVGDRTVTVFQCTLRGNGQGAVATLGRINLALSILDGNGGGVSGAVYTWLNVFKSGATGIGDGDYPNLPQETPVLWLDTPWVGKLQLLPQVVSDKKFDDLPPAITAAVARENWRYDFERELRPENNNLGVGADETAGGLGGAGIWLDCAATPAIVGRDSTVSITVTVQGIDLANSVLRIVPEEPLAGVYPGDVGNPAHYYTVSFSPDTVSEETAKASLATFTVPCGVLSADGSTLCTEGINQIYLVDGDGTVYGPGQAGVTESPAISGSTFLVDTTPPVLLVSDGGGDATAGQPRLLPFPDTNDGAVAIDGPLDWRPRLVAIPTGNGTLADGGLHMFINAGSNTAVPYASAALPAEPLSVALEAVFEDRQPLDPQGNRLLNVTTSGFGPETVTQEGLGYPQNAPNGYARLSGEFGGTAVAGAVLTPTVPTPSFKTSLLNARWGVTGIPGASDPVKLSARMEAKDRVGNEVAPANSLVLWWMWRTQAQITSGPRDTLTLAPRFDWQLRRNGSAPSASESAPNAPLVKFRIWRAADTATDTQISATSWVRISNWSPWQTGPVDGQSVVDGNFLSVLLAANRAAAGQSKTLLVTVVGADEAGNIQQAFAADGNTLNSIADLEASGVAYSWWYNGQNQDNVAVETSARLRLFHEAVANCQGGGEIRNFGTMTRMPLPARSEAASVRAGAEIILGAQLPANVRGMVNVAGGPVATILWKLYEDGALVAQDETALSAAGTVTLSLPGSLTGTAFLNAWFSGCLDRLGDEGQGENFRKREVRYQITAQAKLVTAIQTLIDPTPASAEFSVYPKEFEDAIRDEQPVRVYERE